MDKEIKERENENTTQVSLLGRKYQSVFITSFLSERGDRPKTMDMFHILNWIILVAG